MASASLEDYPAPLMQQIFGPAPPSADPNLDGKKPRELINDKLQTRADRKREHRLNLKPREYQQQLYQRTLEGDVIIFLGTGLGKTLVVAMFIQSPYLDQHIQSGRKVVFMAPTQDLTKQQADYLSSKVPYRCRVYCGRTSQLGIHIDHWDRATWLNELDKIDLMFMTPQIFCSAITSNLLNWESFSAVIFDECHHAARSKSSKAGTPYFQLLQHFNKYYEVRPNVPRPRKIGLTASLINNQPKNAACIGEQVGALECLMRARCVTDIKVMEKRPRMVSHSFINEPQDKCDPIISLLRSFSRRLQEVVEAKARANAYGRVSPGQQDNDLREERRMLSFLNRLKLASSGFSIKPNSFYKVLNQLASIRHRSGLWTFANICQELVKALERHSRNTCVHRDVRPMYQHFAAIFKHILMAIAEYLQPLDLTSSESRTKLLIDYASPKSRALLDVLVGEYKRVHDSTDPKSTYSCIIFVKSRIEVFALNAWLQNVSRHLRAYDFIKCDYAIGISATLASKWACITKRKAADQSVMLDNFRRGSLNVIVTTSVLEEGIDLPVCSTVIRYDKADTFRVYVQSRGRARQQVSSYVSLCPNDEERDYEDTINKYNDFEYRLKELLQGNRIGQDPGHRPITTMPRSDLDTPDEFVLQDGAVRRGGSSAKIILHMYCQRLTRNRPFGSGVQLECHKPTPTTYQTTLYLPAGCPIREGISGNPKRDATLSANSAVIAALYKLFEAKELDENGIPHRSPAVHVEKELLDKNLLRKMEPLGKLEGKETVLESGRILREFPSRVNDAGRYSLACNSNGRTYKLIRIKFVAEPENRNDARRFFVQPIFGLIIDSSLPNDFFPQELTGHYGKFRVVSDVMDERLEIASRELHNKYFNFTLKLMTRCLSLGFIEEHVFRQKCLFYLVLLNDDGSIDTSSMQNTLRPRNYDVDVVVKKRKIFWDKFDSRKRYLVTKIRYDMNARSRIPGRNDNTTFKEQFQQNHRGELLNWDQPIIEVQQISTQIAQTRLISKKFDRNYTSRPLHFLADILEPLCDNPALVFQSFNLPEIIYRLYFARTLLDLNEKFLHETAHRREEILRIPERAPVEVAAPEDDQVSVDSQESYEGDEAYNDEDESDDESDEGADAEYDDEEYPSDESTDEDEILQPVRRSDIPVRQEVNLDKLGEDDDMEIWDVSQYNVPDLKTLNFDKAQSLYRTKSLPGYCAPFACLSSKTKIHEDSIITILQRIRSGVLSDADYLDDGEELQARVRKVDTSLKPPIELDRTSNARVGTYDLSHLLEAMTLRCSGEKYNLEVLENIGDSYLKYFVSVVLYKRLAGDPAVLSEARSRLTGNKYFEYLAKARELGSYAITRPYDDKALLAILTGQQIHNRLRPKDLADLFESMVGASLMYRSEYEAVLAIEWLGLNIVSEDAFAELNPNAVTFSRAPTALLDIDEPAVQEYHKEFKAKEKRFGTLIGYRFNDISYLMQALSHASAPQRCTESYERLEFLGDAILDYLVVRTLVELISSSDQAKSDNFRLTPGQLSMSKSVLVNNYAFAKLAITYCFDCFLSHSNQEILVELDRFTTAFKEEDDLDNLDVSDYDKITKLLADVFEAVAGAIYLDSGCSLDTVWRTYYPMMKNSIDAEVAKPTRNPMSLLYDTFPGPSRITFEVCKTRPDAYDDNVVIKCGIAGFGQFTGKGYSGKQARLRAVREALVLAEQEKEKVAQSNRAYIEAHRSAGQAAGSHRKQRRPPGRGPSRPAVRPVRRR